MKPANRITATMAALAMAACAPTDPGTPPVAQAPPRATCPDGPWRAAGLADGAEGRGPAQGLARLAACGLPTRGMAADDIMDSYLSGHAEGVAIYCSTANAFALGRARQNPGLTCPAPLADRFAAAYAAGLADAGTTEPYLGWPVLRPSIGIGVGRGGRVSGGIGIGIGL